MLVHGPYPIGEERVLREARAAVERGYDVDVVAMRRPGEPAREVDDGCRVFRLPITVGPRTAGRVIYEYVGFLTLATLWLMRAFVRPYDVVQVHNPPDFLLAAAVVPKLRGAKVVFDVHDFGPELFALRFEGAPGVLRVLDRIERWAFRRADLVLTVNERYRERIAGRRGRGGVAVVLNSLDEGLLPEDAPTTNGFRVVTHGTLNEHYGVEVLVEAFRAVRDAVPDARLEILGDGDAVAAIRSRIAELGLGDATPLAGRSLPQREALQRVAGADVGVIANLPLPRNHAALPVKLLEYVAMGIPVVTSDLEAIHDYFDAGEVRFVPGGNSAALAEALLAVANDPAAARAQAARARQRYEAYRWDAQAAAYVGLLDALRSGSGGEAVEQPAE
jgi:glycosyltransferase involved in cell wall biosynthesis